MLPATIAPRAAPSAVATLQELFADSIADIIHELLLSAEATGAGHVVVSVIGPSGDRLLQITDDGQGIAEPATVFAHHLPAFGIFSLAGRDVIIRSWSRAAHQGWCAHVTAAAWSGQRPIAISPDPISHGSSITFRLPPVDVATLAAALREVAGLTGMTVAFNAGAI